MTYGDKHCGKPCPKCPKQQIKLVSIDWKSSKKCPEACFKVDKKFACQKGDLQAVAETWDGKCKDTLKTNEKICVDECGCFCIAIPQCTVALCLKLCIAAPSCDCHYDHGKYKELVGIFSCAFDQPPHRTHCGADDYAEDERDWGYDY